MNENFRFLMYRSAEQDISVNAVIRDETVWLTQKAMAELFGVEVPAISKHLANIFAEGELEAAATPSTPSFPWATASTPAGRPTFASGPPASSRST